MHLYDSACPSFHPSFRPSDWSVRLFISLASFLKDKKRLLLSSNDESPCSLFDFLAASFKLQLLSLLWLMIT